MSPFNHQQKCLINGICGIFDMKSNHVGKVIPKKPKKFQKLDKRAIKCINVFLKIDQNYIAMTKSRGGGVFEV